MSNQLAIAYCLDNKDVAGQLSADVTLLGFSANMAGFSEFQPGTNLSDFLTNYGGRALLLVTDNFFKSPACVFNLLHQVQRLAEQNRLTVVVSHGRILSADGKSWEEVPTAFDRVSNVIQYMNYWQDKYLDLRRQRRQHEDDRLLEEKIETTRRISSEVGELLRFLRNQPVYTLEGIRSNHYRGFIPWSTGELQQSQPETLTADAISGQVEQQSEPTLQPVIQPTQERSLVDLIHDSSEELMAENLELDKQKLADIQEVPAEVAPGDSPLDTQNLFNPPPSPALQDAQPEQSARPSSGAQPTSDSNEDEDLENLLNQVFAEEEEYESDEEMITGREEFDFDSLFGDTDDEEAEELEKETGDEEEEDEEDDFEETLPWEKNFSELAEKVQVEMVANEPLATADDSGEPASAEEILEHAISIFDHGEVQKGLDFLQHRVTANPNDTTLRYYFAYALARYGQDFAEASQQLETLIHLDPGHADAWFLLAELSEIRENFASAREHFEKVASLQPDYPEIFYRLGLLVSQHYEAEVEDAANYFEQAIQKNNRNADAHYRLAALLADQLDQPGKAIEHFQHTLKVYPSHPFANYDIAVLYHRLGELGLAGFYYQKATEINPELKTVQNDAAFHVETAAVGAGEMEQQRGGSEAEKEEMVYSPTIEELLESAPPVKSSSFEDFFTNGHYTVKTEPAPDEIETGAPEKELEIPGSQADELQFEAANAAETNELEMLSTEAEEVQPIEVGTLDGDVEGTENEELEMLDAEAGTQAQGEEQIAFEPEIPTDQKQPPTSEGERAVASTPLQGSGVADQLLEEVRAPEAPLPLVVAENLISPSLEEVELTQSAAEPAPDQPTKATPLVFITGASSGIGKATAEIFAKNGYRLLLAARREERLEDIKTNLEATCNADIHLLHLDVRNLQAVKDAIENLPEDCKNVDILINNAGLARGLAPIHEGDIEHWEQMIDTNIKGLLYLTRAISPHMVARRQGHIINVGSAAGKEVYPKGNVYCATKFAVDALTQGMRLDLYQHGIRVSQVSPGAVEETEFSLVRYDGDEDRAARTYEDFQPLRASDVAEVIYFMATRPPHVNVQDVLLYCTQQGSTRDLDRSGR